MMCRSSKSVLSLLLGLWAGAAAHAQAPAATPAATPAEKPKQAHVRFWNMMPKDSGLLVIVQKGAAPDAAPLSSAEPLNYYASYDPVPPARYDLAVYKGSDRVTQLEHFDVVLRKDVYVTFLATLVEGKPKVEMLDDTFDPTDITAGRLTIRNYFPDARISVSGGPQIQSRVLTDGETQVLEGFPIGSVQLKMEAVLATGKTQRWSAEVDFRNSKRASLLVVPDPYGRFRPRVSSDGPDKAAMAAAAAGAAPAATPSPTAGRTSPSPSLSARP